MWFARLNHDYVHSYSLVPSPHEGVYRNAFSLSQPGDEAIEVAAFPGSLCILQPPMDEASMVVGIVWTILL